MPDREAIKESISQKRGRFGESSDAVHTRSMPINYGVEI